MALAGNEELGTSRSTVFSLEGFGLGFPGGDDTGVDGRDKTKEVGVVGRDVRATCDRFAEVS